jgi:hypothetical protein
VTKQTDELEPFFERVEGIVLGHFSVGDHEAFLLRGIGCVDGGHAGLLTYRTGPRFAPGHPVPG